MNIDREQRDREAADLEAWQHEMNRRTQDNLRAHRLRARRDNLLIGSSLVAAVIIVVGLAWVLPSYLEASAFNRATGKNVSTWEAMFVDLRVQDGAR